MSNSNGLNVGKGGEPSGSHGRKYPKLYNLILEENTPSQEWLYVDFPVVNKQAMRTYVDTVMRKSHPGCKLVTTCSEDDSPVGGETRMWFKIVLRE